MSPETEADSNQPPGTARARYEEDLAYNARRATELAPTHCRPECEDYHFLTPGKRLLSGPEASGIDADRSRLVRHIRKVLEARAGSGVPIDILIAGSADTGQLATCAEAALGQPLAMNAPIRFTVLDRCPTPLELCRHYAETHGLNLTTDTIDFLTTENRYAADVLLLHSLFNFLPRDHQAATLRKFASWLKPDGCIVFVNSTNPSALKHLNETRRSRDLHRLHEAVEAGALDVGETVKALDARISRHHEARSRQRFEFEDVGAMTRLFAAAGVEIATLEEFTRNGERLEDRTRQRTSVLAILRPGRPPRGD